MLFRSEGKRRGERMVNGREGEKREIEKRRERMVNRRDQIERD